MKNADALRCCALASVAPSLVAAEAQPLPRLNLLRHISPALIFAVAVSAFGTRALAQPSPTAQAIPLSQNWGTVPFGSMPPGFAAWNGLNGGTVTNQTKAETSEPTGYAPVTAGAPTATGGCYGYAISGDARFAVVTSGNATNGVNQLVMAINTSGKTNVGLSYDLINAVPAPQRTLGVVCQYRVGTSGPWTTITGGSGNPYIQTNGTAGTVTPASLTLPAAAENQPMVQIRWAVWRGTEGGSSAAYAIDNIIVTGSAPTGPAITAVTLSGSSFDVGDTAVVGVQLSSAPPAGTPAVVSVASGAFGTANVTITNPATSGSANVTMANSGVWTAVGTAVSGCAGSATSSSFSVGTTGQPPTAYAGPDRTLNLNGGLTCLMTDAAADDPDGLTGLTYAWMPISGTGLTGWIGRTGSVIDVSSPSEAQVTITATGSYTFTLTVTDPTGLTASDSVTVTVVDTSPAGPYGPPAGYYAPARPGGVWLTGTNLKNALTGIIDGHTVRSYDAAKQALQLLDADPVTAGNIVLVYTGESVLNDWDAGETWNREHLWPDSLNGSGAADSDLFNLRACDPVTNSTRSNLPYGIGSGYWDPNRAPGVHDRGFCARSMFYMATRYSNLTLVNDKPRALEMGDLARLLEWHYQEPVSTFERRRNHLIWSSTDNPGYYQGNRNPYVDYPELVWTVYGGGDNNSKIYLGGAVPGDGSSAVEVAWRVIRNSPAPSQNVTLNKIGTNPTTYNILTTGEAVSAAAGSGQAFPGGTQTRIVTVSISSTATSGTKTGSVVIDNTELSSGGTGLGSADGNDVVHISAAVLERSNASFTMPADGNTLTIDFGSIQAGSTTSDIFTIYNLEAVPGATADLDIDAVIGGGDTAILTTNLAAPASIAAGDSAVYTASFNASLVGSYSATYTIAVSDEDIAGAAPGASLTLTLTGSVVTVRPDFTGNGYVNSDDFDFLSACSLGPDIPQELPGCSAARLDGDSDVDADDFGIFQRCYSGSAALPALDCAD